MNEKINLTGKKFGRYTVIQEAEPYVNPKGHHIRRWMCKCDCGTIKCVVQSKLTCGSTLSCGCLGKERRASSIRKHGMAKTRLYHIYRSMVSRCCRKNDVSYQFYGERGIAVCDDWLGENGFNEFRSWSMMNGYADTFSIDRIDPNRGYGPENCRWIPVSEQQSNKRNNCFIEIDGITQTMSQWAKIYDIGYTTIQARLKRGWDAKEAVITPVNKRFSHRNELPNIR